MAASSDSVASAHDHDAKGEREPLRERFELDKYKVEQEVSLQRERLALDREKATREGRFGSNPALISAAISLAAVLVSASQVWAAFISKDKELALADKHRQLESDQRHDEHQHQWNLDRAKFVTENREALFGADPGTRQRMAMIIQTVFPEVAAQITGEPWQPSETVGPVAESEHLTLQRAKGDAQLIPVGAWKSFEVRVVDASKHPVRGAKVAWQMPDRDPEFTYVGETNASGISSATNMYTSGAAGTFAQTATIVARYAPVGFTVARKVTKIGEPVKFTFEQK